jgi:hypothetical protein
MEKRSDFDSELIAALQAAATTFNVYFDTVEQSKAHSAKFVKAAVALRTWYRHQAIAFKPELVVQHTKDLFEVYGDTRIERRANGELIVMAKNNEIGLQYVEMSNVGRFLANRARASIQQDYYKKAEALVEAQSSLTVPKNDLLKTLESVDGYVVTNMNVHWWRPRCTVADDARVLGRLLWDAGMIDRDVFSQAVRLRGFKFTMDVYNICAIYKEELAERTKEAPNMVPWLWTSLPNTQLYGRRHAINVHQTVWKDLKEHFLSLGGTAQAWRWLCGQGHTWFKYYELEERHIKLFNALGSLQLGRVPFHPGLVGRVHSQIQYGQGDRTRFLDVFKAAAVAHRKRKLKVGEFDSYNLIFDYLQRVPTASTKGATWNSLMRKQHVWHMEEARKEVERRKEAGGCVAWAPIIQSVQQDDLEAVSLNNSDELWEEGAAQVHCVGGYDERCYHNYSRIYSIRRNGERLATMELRFDNGKLTIGQLYGQGNTVIKDKSVNLFAKKVLSLCKRAPKLEFADNKVIRQPKGAGRRYQEPQPPQEEQPQQFFAARREEEADEEIPF